MFPCECDGSPLVALVQEGLSMLAVRLDDVFEAGHESSARSVMVLALVRSNLVSLAATYLIMLIAMVLALSFRFTCVRSCS
jgi:hypothetical protein